MFLLLNLLWVVLDWSLFLSSPNKDNTNFQILVNAILLLATLMTANLNSEIVFVLGMSIFILNLLVSLPMIVMANASDRGTSEYKVENSTNESNSISKSENITLTFPWRSYNFRNVTLNPKFIENITNYKIKKKETSLNILLLLFLKNIFTSRVLKVTTLESDRKELLKFK